MGKERDKVKIIGFMKVFNEGSPEKGGTGLIEYPLKCLTKICGKGNIAVCNDSSTDNTVEIVKRYTDHVITLPNDFINERLHKQKLLEYVVKEIDPDYILWFDGDEILEKRSYKGIKKLCDFMDEFNIDGASFHTVNLYLSQCWARKDSMFDSKWDIKLWKNNGKLVFDTSPGLHKPQHPNGIETAISTGLQIIHLGFMSLKLIVRKLLTYEKYQSGFALERLRPDKSMEFYPVNLKWFDRDVFFPKIEPKPKPVKTEDLEKILEEKRHA